MQHTGMQTHVYIHSNHSDLWSEHASAHVCEMSDRILCSLWPNFSATYNNLDRPPRTSFIKLNSTATILTRNCLQIHVILVKYIRVRFYLLWQSLSSEQCVCERSIRFYFTHVYGEMRQL